MKSLLNSLMLVAAPLLLFLSGCGGDGFSVEPAKGKVVSGGQPVTTGSVTFIPIGTGLETGKPASAAIGPDGTFVLSTFERFDGAIVGKHRVQYTGPEDEENEEAEEIDEAVAGDAASTAAYKQRLAKAKEKPQYVQKDELILEVTASGPNDFTIELSPAGK